MKKVTENLLIRKRTNVWPSFCHKLMNTSTSSPIWLNNTRRTLAKNNAKFDVNKGEKNWHWMKILCPMCEFMSKKYPRAKFYVGRMLLWHQIWKLGWKKIQDTKKLRETKSQMKNQKMKQLERK